MGHVGSEKGFLFNVLSLIVLVGSILILHLIVELVKSLLNSNVTKMSQDREQGFGS